MNLDFNFYHHIIFLGISTGIGLGVILITTRNFKNRENLFLGIFLISFAVNNLYYFLVDINLKAYWPIVDYLPLTLSTLIPVSAYLYISTIIKPKARFIFEQKVLFVPIAMQMTFYLILFFIFVFSQGIIEDNFHLVKKLFDLEELMVIFFTIVLAFDVIKQLHIARKEPYSNTTYVKSRLAWVKKFFMICLGIILLWIIPYIYGFLTDTFVEETYYPLWCISSLVIYWIGYLGLVQPGFFHKTDTIESKSGAINSIESNNNSQHKALMDKLHLIMQEQQPFKNSKFTLKELSVISGISENKLSGLFKKRGENFYRFVNKYRVEEAKRLLRQPNYLKYTIEIIGEDAGFNSRASFFHTFKKLTGRTPQKFREETI